MRFIKVLFLLALFAFTLLFLVQNSGPLFQEITFRFNLYFENLQWESVTFPLFFVILAAFVLGALVTMFFLFMDRLRLGRELARTRKNMRKMEKEITALRQLPLMNPSVQAGPEAKEEAPGEAG